MSRGSYDQKMGDFYGKFELSTRFDIEIFNVDWCGI
jgi:hypothetical protein